MTGTEIRPEGSAFSRFVASPYGRVLRVAIGSTVIGAGLFVISPPLGLGIAAFGLLPLVTGMFNLCPVAPIWGGHFIGAKYCPARNR